MSGVKRYDAVHIRYEDSNIRYGEGCEVEVVAAYDYDQLAAENNRLREALIKAEAMLSELDYVGEMTELGKAHLVEMRAALFTTANGQLASASEGDV